MDVQEVPGCGRADAANADMINSALLGIPKSATSSNEINHHERLVKLAPNLIWGNIKLRWLDALKSSDNLHCLITV